MFCWRAPARKLCRSRSNLGYNRYGAPDLSSITSPSSRDRLHLSITTRETIGFLSEKSRLLVLMSRARDGLFIISDYESFVLKKTRGTGALTRIREEMKVIGAFYTMPLGTVCSPPEYWDLEDQFRNVGSAGADNLGTTNDGYNNDNGDE